MPASCSFCSKPQTNPLRCSACHVAVYCSKDCQRKHWKSHKDQCKKIQSCTGTMKSKTESKTESRKGDKTTDKQTESTSTRTSSRNQRMSNSDTGQPTSTSAGLRGTERRNKADPGKTTSTLSGHEKTGSSTSGEKKPDSTSGGEKPDSTSGEKKPDSTSGEKKPDSTSGEKKPDSTSGEKKPDSTSGEKKPDSTSGEKKPDSTSGGERGAGKVNSGAGRFSSEGRKCPTCGSLVPQGSGELCVGCKETLYCSDVCRRRDFDNHIRKCEALKEEIKNRLHLSYTLNASGGLEFKDIASYSLSDLRKIDPKASGSNPTNGKEADTAKIMECHTCKIKDGRMKSCGRCTKVFYCSTDCQKKDWPLHKKDCQNIEGYIETNEFKKQKKQKGQRKRTGSEKTELQHFIDIMEQMDKRSEEEMQFEPSQPCMPITEARILARNHFSLSNIVEELSRLPQQRLFVKPRDRSTVLLARMSRFHEYKKRHSIFIKDTHGQETFVMFYVPNDNPMPHFSWNQIVPGNYLCFQSPYFHHFADGTTGIRVDDPSEVFIIHKALKL